MHQPSKRLFRRVRPTLLALPVVLGVVGGFGTGIVGCAEDPHGAATSDTHAGDSMPADDLAAAKDTALADDATGTETASDPDAPDEAVETVNPAGAQVAFVGVVRALVADGGLRRALEVPDVVVELVAEGGTWASTVTDLHGRYRLAGPLVTAPWGAAIRVSAGLVCDAVTTAPEAPLGLADGDEVHVTACDATLTAPTWGEIGYPLAATFPERQPPTPPGAAAALRAPLEPLATSPTVALAAGDGTPVASVRANSDGEFVFLPGTARPVDGTLVITRGAAQKVVPLEGDKTRITLDALPQFTLEPVAPDGETPIRRGVVGAAADVRILGDLPKAPDGTCALDVVPPAAGSDEPIASVDPGCERLSWAWDAGLPGDCLIPECAGTCVVPALETVFTDPWGTEVHEFASLGLPERAVDLRVDVTAEGATPDGITLAVDGAPFFLGGDGAGTASVSPRDAATLVVRADGFAPVVTRAAALDPSQPNPLKVALARATRVTFDGAVDAHLAVPVACTAQGATEDLTLDVPAGALTGFVGNDGQVDAWISVFDRRDPETATALGDGRATSGFVHPLMAVDVAFRGSAGEPLTLASGQVATLQLPCMDAGRFAESGGGMLALAQEYRTLWHLDETTGQWEAAGEFTLQTPAGASAPVPTAQVSSFSTVSFGPTVSDPACINVAFSARRFHVPFTLRWSQPPGPGFPLGTGAAVQVATSPVRLDGLRPNVPTTMVVEGPSRRFVMTRMTVNPGGPRGTGACKASAVLTVRTGAERFLSRYWNDATDAVAYYAAIDPDNKRMTVNQFATANGFGPSDVRAIFQNAGDLNFGRYMHMNRDPSPPAFYVTNFLDVDDAVHIRLKETGKERDCAVPVAATVAMEYTPGTYAKLPGGGHAQTTEPFIKFFVYDGGGQRTVGIDLDGDGVDENVPGGCTPCHGGGAFRGDARVGARMLPFDLDSFEYSTLDAGNWKRAPQEDDFRAMNVRIATQTNASTAEKELVAAWYGGATHPAVAQDSDAVPPAWSGAAGLYLDAVKPACRTCHVAREHTLGDVAWQSFQAFKDWQDTIDYDTCDSFAMPHAKVTYFRFWTSDFPHQPQTLHDGLALPTPCP